MTKGGGSAPALQALHPKYTKDWSLHPLPVTCRNQEHHDVCTPLSLACPHQIQTSSLGFSLAVPRAVIWERTGREGRAELLSKHLNPQELSWLLPHPHPGRRFQSRAEQEQPGLTMAQGCPQSPEPFPGLAVPPLCQTPASQPAREQHPLYSDREHGASSDWRVRHRNKPKHCLYVWRCTFMNVVYIALF